jgi:methylthioribose-1-phosphate isomerase
MRVNSEDCRTIVDRGGDVEVIDQTRLPHQFLTLRLRSLADAANAIRNMVVRGAPLIGVTGAYGMALAMRESADDESIARASQLLEQTRPTAVDLRWSLERMSALLAALPRAQRAGAAYAEAGRIAEESVAMSSRIGEHGLALIEARRRADGPVNILTHCNAGWLAAVDWGTALAPVFKAHRAGIPLHVWVDETRPRNQGASLTAWELAMEGIAHTVIADNAGGHLMQHGRVDLCLVGSDRVTRSGDVCNKIGTYLKALAAKDNGVPFYAVMPSSTIDWRIRDGLREIPIEQRGEREVTHICGATESGAIETVRLTPAGSAAANFGFDVTPAHLITAIVTEAGICQASERELSALFPDRARAERAKAYG